VPDAVAGRRAIGADGRTPSSRLLVLWLAPFEAWRARNTGATRRAERCGGPGARTLLVLGGDLAPRDLEHRAS
jgi:hypothetical protein